MQPNIIIIGAGLGGLCLAQGLKRASIPFRIFERDSSVGRSQGYRISIVPDGTLALQSTLPANLWEMFEQTAAKPPRGYANLKAVDGQAYQGDLMWFQKKPAAGQQAPPQGAPQATLVAPQGAPNGGPQGGPPQGAPHGPQGGPQGSPAGKNYTVDRATLRTLLTIGLEEHIQYSSKLERFETKEGGVTAFFQDGTQYSGSLLVAADGANSVVRRQHIPQHLLYDTDLRCIYGKTPITEEFRSKYHPEAIQFTSIIRQEDAGLHMLADPVHLDRNPHVVDGRLPHVDDYIYWALLAKSSVFAVPDEKLLRMTSDEAAALSVKLTSQWHPSFRALLEMQDKSQSAVIRMHTSNPAAPQWPASAHVTLIGDAAHAMLPTGASGANTALRDAVNMIKLLEESKGLPTVEKVAAFEKEMREYGGGKVGFSIQNGVKMFNIPTFEAYKPIAQ